MATKTIKYIGTAPLPEESITGSKRVWDYGQTQSVDSVVATQLLTTGLFEDDAGTPVSAKTNPLTGEIVFSTDMSATVVPQSSKVIAGLLRPVSLTAGRPIALTQGTNYSAFPGFVKTTTGRLVAAYRSASGHLSVDGSIIVRYSDDQGASWTTGAVAVATSSGKDWRDPSLSQTLLGVTMTFFRWDGVNGTGAFYSTSGDDGVTWSSPIALPAVDAANPSDATAFDAVTAPMITLANGDLFVPIYGRNGAFPLRENAKALISTDRGVSWLTYPIALGATQGVDWEEPFAQALKDGRVMVTIRAPLSGSAWVTYSSDNGKTWTTPVIAFAAGDARNSFTQRADGVIVAVYKSVIATSSYYCPAARMSYDAGVTWTPEQSLGTSLGNFSYAQLAEVTPGVVGVVMAQDGHSSKCSVSFRYLAGPPRVTPLGDAGALRLPNLAVANPTGMIVFDTFSRTNEASLDHSIADSGHQWRAISGSAAIINGAVSGVTNWNPTFMVLDAVTANVEVSMAWFWTAAATEMGVVLRASDISNLLRVVNTTQTNWKLQKVSAGVTTDLVSITTGIDTPPGCLYRVRVVAKDKRIRVFLDDEKIMDYTLTGPELTKYGVNTLHGFSVYHTTHKVRNFSISA